MAQPDPPAGKPRRAHWTIVSVALIILGLLVVLPSGLCVGTGIVGLIYVLIFERAQASDALPAVGMMLIIGAPFLAGGIAMILSGWKARRRD
jgi:4-hydroxybenzoate polyprenyltransferase